MHLVSDGFIEKVLARLPRRPVRGDHSVAASGTLDWARAHCVVWVCGAAALRR
jgi:hypothetical protein